MTDTAAVLAAHRWANNAALIADVARLHLHPGMLALDATYGRGKWWDTWTPDRLITVDLCRGTPQVRADFTALPFRPGTFDLIAYDPPYKLNGTPSAPDAPYGVDEPTSRADRQALIVAGVTGCADALAPGGTMLVKIQDQVNGGKMRWQSIMVAVHAATLGLRLVDEFTLLGGRPQPDGRSQDHARERGSVLMVFRHDPRHTAAVTEPLTSLDGPVVAADRARLVEVFA